jgi:hypothetical protein
MVQGGRTVVQMSVDVTPPRPNRHVHTARDKSVDRLVVVHTAADTVADRLVVVHTVRDTVADRLVFIHTARDTVVDRLVVVHTAEIPLQTGWWSCTLLEIPLLVVKNLNRYREHQSLVFQDRQQNQRKLQPFTRVVHVALQRDGEQPQIHRRSYQKLLRFLRQ